MSLEDTELNVGGVKLTGVYIALVATLVSSIGGVIWTASSLYGRLESLEDDQIPEDRIVSIETQMQENNVSELGAKLATLGTNLEQILQSQGELLELRTQVIDVEQTVAEMKATVTSAELVVNTVETFEGRLSSYEARFDKQDREADDLWRAIDDVSSNPLGN